MNEFEFISWLRKALDRPASATGVPVGIGDDMAVIDFLGGKLLLGSDMVIQNIHFTFPEAKPEHVGHKAIGRCLSDCAAMAGEPVAAIVSVATSPEISEDILKEVFQGMMKLTDRFHCPIVGGDTSHSEKGLILDVCLLGKCQRNAPILRSTAKVGDYLYITGPLGGSILGKHLVFTPRIEEGLWIAGNLPVHAMIDISDGLSSDLGHMCEESRCGAELFSRAMESAISADARNLAARTGKEPMDHAINDGEDFELLAAIGISPSELPHLPLNVQLLPIGRIVAEPGVSMIYPTGRRVEIRPGGYRHF
jgi:thiamine-monophosphate kinase